MIEKEYQKKLLHDRGICVVIPTYNNAGTIGSVVNKALVECNDIIVVNDGSTDETSSILRSIPQIALVEYDKNRGKGYALKKGLPRRFRWAFRMQ